MYEHERYRCDHLAGRGALLSAQRHCHHAAGGLQPAIQRVQCDSEDQLGGQEQVQGEEDRPYHGKNHSPWLPYPAAPLHARAQHLSPHRALCELHTHVPVSHAPRRRQPAAPRVQKRHVERAVDYGRRYKQTEQRGTHTGLKHAQAPAPVNHPLGALRPSSK
eukprot:3626152-Rhodomonas_salina.1